MQAVQGFSIASGQIGLNSPSRINSILIGLENLLISFPNQRTAIEPAFAIPQGAVHDPVRQ
jgi:hypothetical protein